MLAFFVTPYEDECFYSMLCRYHKRTGNVTHQTTIRELFGTNKAAISSMFPNGCVHALVNNLPKGHLTEEEIIIKHTLFPFFTRCLSAEKKQEYMDKICRGEGVHSPLKWHRTTGADVLKFCPECVRADKQKHGESYWHLSHQMPLTDVCVRHRCRLRSIRINRTKKDERFLFPEDAPGECRKDPMTDDEFLLVETALSWQTGDIKTTANSNYSNILLQLKEHGYNIVSRENIDSCRVHAAMEEKFGPAYVREYFGDKPQAFRFLRIGKWEYASTECYVMLAALVGQSFDETFGPEISVKDEFYEKLLALRDEPELHSRKYVADALGVQPGNLKGICSRYGIEPFWSKNDTGKTACARIYLTPDLKERTENYCRDNGYPSVSEFIGFLIEREIKPRDSPS